MSSVVKDHKGNEYTSVKNMCDAYNLTYSIFRLRLKQGYTLEEALLVPKGLSRETYKKRIDGGFTYDNNNLTKWEIHKRSK